MPVPTDQLAAQLNELKSEVGSLRKDALEHQDVAAGRSGRARQKDLGHASRRELRDELVAAKIPSVARD